MYENNFHISLRTVCRQGCIGSGLTFDWPGKKHEYGWCENCAIVINMTLPGWKE